MNIELIQGDPQSPTDGDYLHCNTSTTLGGLIDSFSRNMFLSLPRRKSDSRFLTVLETT